MNFNPGYQMTLPSGLTIDAQAALGFVISQTSFIEAGINETVYPDIQYPELIPVDMSAWEFAKSVTYFSGDRYGVAKWINGNSNDIPRAGSELTKHETMVHTAALGYGWGWEEVGHAMMIGYNLSAVDAAAARRGAEEMADRVFLLGDAEKGFDGLIDHSAVTPANAPNGGWGDQDTSGAYTTTTDQIMEDVNGIILGAGSDTNWTSLADTLLLPHDALASLSARTIPGTAIPLLRYVMENNWYKLQTGRDLRIRAIRGLETAGVGNTRRMIAYRRSPDVLKAHMPMPHRFLPVWQSGPLNWEVPGVMRLGGLDIRRPKEVLYRDGI